MPKQIRVARDLPLMAQVRDLVRFAKEWHQEPIIERKLVYAKCPHEFAVGVIAYKRYYGREVPDMASTLAKEGLAIARLIMDDLIANGEYLDDSFEWKVNKDIIPANMYQTVTPAVPCWNGEGSAYGVGLSDKARKERAQELRGSGFYHGSRVVRKGNRCKPFGQLLPEHWRTGA